MSRTRLVVYGAGYLGQQIYHHLAAWYGESAEVLGFIDDTKPAGLAVIDGKSTLGALETVRQDPALGPQAARAVFAIGYTSMTARRAALERVVAGGWPFIVCLVLSLLAVTYFPAASTWLPGVLMK